MIELIRDNIGNILCSAVLIVVLVLIVGSMIRDKKKGKTSCGCGCSNCAMAGRCHAAKGQD